MISEWSCDTEDWSNGCWKFSFAITGINYNLTSYQLYYRQLMYWSITSIHKMYVVVIDLFTNLYDLKMKMQRVWWVKTPLMYSNPTSPISLSFSMLPSSRSSWRSENHLLMCSSDTLSHGQPLFSPTYKLQQQMQRWCWREMLSILFQAAGCLYPPSPLWLNTHVCAGLSGRRAWWNRTSKRGRKLYDRGTLKSRYEWF